MRDASSDKRRPEATRHACLVVPASSQRMLAKARALLIDEVGLDLEDDLVAELKGKAHAAAVAATAGAAFALGLVSARIGAAGAPWAHDDLTAPAGAERPASSLVVREADGAGDLVFGRRIWRRRGNGLGYREPLAVELGMRLGVRPPVLSAAPDTTSPCAPARNGTA